MYTPGIFPENDSTVDIVRDWACGHGVPISELSASDIEQVLIHPSTRESRERLNADIVRDWGNEHGVPVIDVQASPCTGVEAQDMCQGIPTYDALSLAAQLLR